MTELGTRHVPWETIEVVHARNRPWAERYPLPAVGDMVWYRHNHWDHNPHTGEVEPPELCTVAGVQDADEYDDVNLWQRIFDQQKRPVVDPSTSRQLIVPCPDPWPWLLLQRPDRYKPGGGFAGRGLQQPSRESRMRGSAGWLPLDYRTRPERVRLPAETLLVQRPPLRPYTDYLPGGT